VLLRLASLYTALGATVALASCHPRPTPAPAFPSAAASVVESSRFATSQAPVASSRVSSGVLEGLVIEEESGQPIDKAQIWVASTTAGTLTDSTGRFRVTIPDSTLSIRIMRIGYAPSRVDAVLERDSGYVMVAALTRVRVSLCSVTVGGAFMEVRDARGKVTLRMLNTAMPRSGVVILAHDALTGRAPAAPLSITVADRDYRDSLVVTADSLGRVARTIAPDRPGTYEVTVRSPDDRDWRGSAATQPVPGCPGEFAPAVFRAWLVPR